MFLCGEGNFLKEVFLPRTPSFKNFEALGFYFFCYCFGCSAVVDANFVGAGASTALKNNQICTRYY